MNSEYTYSLSSDNDRHNQQTVKVTGEATLQATPTKPSLHLGFKLKTLIQSLPSRKMRKPSQKS